MCFVKYINGCDSQKQRDFPILEKQLFNLDKFTPITFNIVTSGIYGIIWKALLTPNTCNQHQNVRSKQLLREKNKCPFNWYIGSPSKYSSPSSCTWRAWKKFATYLLYKKWNIWRRVCSRDNSCLYTILSQRFKLGTGLSFLLLLRERIFVALCDLGRRWFQG